MKAKIVEKLHEMAKKTLPKTDEEKYSMEYFHSGTDKP